MCHHAAYYDKHATPRVECWHHPKFRHAALCTRCCGLTVLVSVCTCPPYAMLAAAPCPDPIVPSQSHAIPVSLTQQLARMGRQVRMPVQFMTVGVPVRFQTTQLDAFCQKTAFYLPPHVIALLCRCARALEGAQFRQHLARRGG